MQRSVVFASLVAVVAAGAQFAACTDTTVFPPATDGGGGGSSGSGGGSSGGGSGSGSSGSGSGSSGGSGNSSGGVADSGSDTGADSGGGVLLTVKNYEAWCSVTINGGAAFTTATGAASVAEASRVTIVATPLPGFELGADPWFGTDENDGGAAAGTDVDSGTTMTSTAQVTIGAGPTQCVSVCCQTAGSPDCPTANPCP